MMLLAHASVGDGLEALAGAFILVGLAWALLR